MRSIKFRGKTLQDRGMLPAGSWVTGGYCRDDCYGGCPEGKHYIITWNSAGPGGFTDLIQVDPETVGQYAGLEDRNGKKISEGDWFDFVDPYDGDRCQGEVVYCEGEFAIKVDGDILCSLNELISGEHVEGEVIGNIPA